MFGSLTTWLKETIRCTRHNLLHLKIFKMSYRGGRWHVTDGDVHMVFGRYPYLPFYDIEGYLRDGKFAPKPGEVVLDVGGCHGEFAVYAAKKVGPSGRVLMLEPDPGNIDVAREFFAMNGSPANIEIVPAGLWDSKTVLRFAAGQGEISAIVDDKTDAAGVIEIPTHSLASLAEEYKLAKIDFVKMDIEGAELEAVRGAAQLPASIKPRFAIAAYHLVNGEKTATTLEPMFKAMGYDVRSGHPQHLTTWASPTPLGA